MEIKQAVQALSALAQQSRLEIFRLLVERGEEGMPAGEIASALNIASPTLSFHLKELVNSGLLEDSREGRSVRYAPRVEGIRALFAFLLQDCCRGNPHLCTDLQMVSLNKISTSRGPA